METSSPPFPQLEMEPSLVQASGGPKPCPCGPQGSPLLHKTCLGPDPQAVPHAATLKPPPHGPTTWAHPGPRRATLDRSPRTRPHCRLPTRDPAAGVEDDHGPARTLSSAILAGRTGKRLHPAPATGSPLPGGEVHRGGSDLTAGRKYRGLRSRTS